MKFFPQETEAVLEAEPAVLEACVYRRAHARLGDEAWAQVVLRPGASSSEAQLKEVCARRLAIYKVPARIELVAALAKTASGKRIRDGERLPAASGGIHG
jgi:acyl-CoA synthetase (AMP-forming)/AMP-acid ligase II